MSLRFGTLYNGGYYHIFSRAVEGIEIFKDWRDLERFCDLLELVATEERVVSVQSIKKGETKRKKDELEQAQKLVSIEAFAVLPNHFHLLIRQETDEGVARFMQKLSAGYSRYFNTRYRRSGRLWMGTYKFIELRNESQYLRIGAYVSRNHDVHGFTDTVSPLRTNSSYPAMMGKARYPFCDHESLLEAFGGVERYDTLSREIIQEVVRRRAIEDGEDKDLFLEM